MTAAVDANGHTTLTDFDAAGQVTATVNADGQTAHLYYDASGNVTASVDALGRTTLQDFDAAGNVTATIDPAGATSYQEYGSNGLLTASVDALGRSTVYDYDPSQRLTATIDPLGHTSLQIYDSFGNVTATVDASGATSFQFYDTANEVTASVDADGRTALTDYDAAGQVTATVDALGHTALQYYDANGNVTASVDAAGDTTRTDYDAAGQVTATVDALGKTSYQDYDLNGQVTATVDALGHTTFTDYNAAGQVTAAIDANGHTTFTDYNAAGQVTATVDALGKTSLTEYDDAGQVTATVDALGRTTLTEYDAAGQMTATVDALGHTTLTDYDAAGRVTASVDPLGHTSLTFYDAAGQATESVDADGHTSRTDYDAAGQATATVDALGKTSLTDYDADGRVTASVDANGHTTFTEYDNAGQATATVDPLGKTSLTDYDAAGRVTASVDANGHTTLSDYDANGNVTATVDALGKTSYQDFDANGQMTASVDANGHTSFTRYDANGQATATVDADGYTSLTMFDPAGNATETVDADGYTAHNYYDADNRLTESVNGAGQTATNLYDAVGELTHSVDVNGLTTTIDYDADGNVTLSVNSLGATMQQDYDADNRVTMSIDGDHNTIRQLYDANGQVTATVDGRGYTSLQEFDADGRLTASVDQDGDTTQYKLDANGNQTAVIDPDLNTTTMDYDADGRVTATISPTGGTTLQSYDADGNLTATIAADDSSIVQSYDTDGRETQAVWYDPGHSVVDTQNKTYDNDGDLLTASNVNGTYAFSYDPDNRVTQVSEPFGQTLGYAYDGNGNQTQTVDSFGGTQTSIYDVQARLVTREYTGESQNLRVDFVYTAEGQIATQTDYDSLSGPGSPSADLVAVTDYSFDADNNVTAVLSTDASTATIDQFVYTLDQAGNISSEVDTQGGTPTTTSYSYDHANQLTAAGGSNYSYDSSGNRDSAGYTTTLGNEMTSDGTYNYTYDAKGNEITKTDIATGDKWTYGYDNLNEMTSAVEETSGSVVEQTVEFKYDIFGNRTEVDATVGTTTSITRYAYDGWNPAKSAGATGTDNFDVWATFTSLGSLTNRELQGDGIDQHLAYVQSSNAYWYLTDHLNSIRAVINNSGSVQDSIVYDGYGNITYQTPSPATTPLYFYTGREFDVETGLQYNRARYYDATTGRWISQDPMGFDAGDSNLYRYVTNNPTGRIDPSGRDAVEFYRFTGGGGGNVWWMFHDENGNENSSHEGGVRLGTTQGGPSSFVIDNTWDYWIRGIGGKTIDLPSLQRYVGYLHGHDSDRFDTNLGISRRTNYWAHGGLGYVPFNLMKERIALVLRNAVINKGMSPSPRAQISSASGLHAFVEGLGDGAKYLVGKGVEIGGKLVESGMDSVQTFVDGLADKGRKVLGLYDALKNFGSALPTVVTSAINDPMKFFRTIGTGLKSGFESFTDGLLKNGVGRLLNWVAGTNIELPQEIGQIVPIALRFVGLDWDSLLGQVASVIGPTNLAVINSIGAAVSTLMSSDESVPNQILSFAKQNLEGFDIQEKVLNGVKGAIVNGIPSIVKQLTALLVPGVGQVVQAVGQIYDIADAFVSKADQWAEDLGKLTQGALALAKGDSDGLAHAVSSALDSGLNIALNFIGSIGPVKTVLDGIRSVVKEIQSAVPDLIRAGLLKAKNAFLGGLSLGGGTGGASLLVAPVPNGSKTARLAVFSSSGGPVLRYAVNNTTSWRPFTPSTQSQTSQATDAVRLASEMETIATRMQAPSPGSPAPAAAANPSRTADVRQLADLSRQEQAILASLCNTITGCFAAGTMLLSPSGPRAIEEFQVGDAITSRNEFEPGGALEVKVVEEVFRRTARIVHLHVGGQVIRTTSEHPFFAYNKGWVEPSLLDVGDRLLGHDGQWVAVEDVLDTGEWEVVYNLRIADYHTYFVTDWDWGFSVWSHNTYTIAASGTRLVHYTTAAGLPSILSSQEIRESTGPTNAKDGDGTYFTDIFPEDVGARTIPELTAAQVAAGKISLGTLAARLYGMPFQPQMDKVASYVVVDMSGLPITRSTRPDGRNTIVVKTVDLRSAAPERIKANNNLDVSGKIVRSGATLP